MDSKIIKEVNRIKKCDIVVGIPCYNSVATIEHVINTVDEGLIKHYADKKAVIIISDGNSFDGTYKLANDLVTISDKIVTNYIGIPGKGSAVRTIFEIAKRLDAKAVVTVDSDLRSIVPDWMFNLIEPILKHNVDMATPIYYRNKYNATITRLFVRPLVASIFKRDIEQPIGGDFAFSQKFIQYCLNQNVWSTNIAKFGIDIWLTTTAILQKFNMNQVRLGNKIHNAKTPIDLGTMFLNVAETLLNIIYTSEEIWKETKLFKQVTEFHGVSIGSLIMDKPKPDTSFIMMSMIDILERTPKELNSISNIFLNLKTTDLLLNIIDKLWANLTYSLMLLYYKTDNRVYKKDILKLLLALYYGKCINHFDAVAIGDITIVENEIINQFVNEVQSLDYL